MMPKDLTGMRFGRLVVIGLDPKPYRSPSGKPTRRWICKCDCGNQIVVLQNALTSTKNGTKSCGCARKEALQKLAAERPLKMVERKCVICGKAFSCYPSDNRVTCSNECRRERQRRQVTARPVKWSDEAKNRLSQKGRTENLCKGAEAAKRSPIAGRGETNREAKIWVLISPDGREFTVRNLLHWARAHTDLFGKPPGDKSAIQIASGFAAIAQTLKGNRGAPGKRPGATTYFGWSMLDLPKEPDDPPGTDDHKK